MPDAPIKFAAVEHLEPGSGGELERVQPATYLERWNTIFVAAGLLWMLCVTSGLFVYYLLHRRIVRRTG